jgi:hypothetical protein
MTPTTEAEWEAMVASYHAALDEFTERLSAALTSARGLRLTKGEHTYLVGPNVGSDAPYRITSFHDGEPSGHMEFSTLESLAREAYGFTRQGYE